MKWNCSHFRIIFPLKSCTIIFSEMLSFLCFWPMHEIGSKKGRRSYSMNFMISTNWASNRSHKKKKKVMLLFDRWNPIHAMDNMLHILMQMAFCQMLLCSITQRATWYAAQYSNENSVKLLGQSFSSMVVSYFCSVFYHRKNIRIWNVYCSFGSTVPKHIGNVFHFNILHRHKTDSRRISKI